MTVTRSGWRMVLAAAAAASALMASTGTGLGGGGRGATAGGGAQASYGLGAREILPFAVLVRMPRGPGPEVVVDEHRQHRNQRALGADATSVQVQQPGDLLPGSARGAGSSAAGAPDGAAGAFSAGPPNPAVLLPGGLIRRAAHAAPAIVASLPWALATRVTVGQDSAGPQPTPSSEGQLAAGPRSVATAGTLSLPRWRAVLENRWQARLSKVTELSVAYHDTAELIQAAYHSGDHASQRQLQRLLHQAVTARRALADTEEALSRLSAGRYGRCEQCAAAISPRRLALTPEVRYCPRCAPEPAMPPR